MNKLAIPLIAALSLAATPVLAGHKHRHRDYYPAYDPYYPPQAAAEPRYAPQTIEYADVISAQPIYRSVRIEQPRRECWDERVVREEHRGGPWFNNGVAGSAIGAIAGQELVVFPKNAARAVARMQQRSSVRSSAPELVSGSHLRIPRRERQSSTWVMSRSARPLLSTQQNNALMGMIFPTNTAAARTTPECLMTRVPASPSTSMYVPSATEKQRRDTARI